MENQQYTPSKNLIKIVTSSFLDDSKDSINIFTNEAITCNEENISQFVSNSVRQFLSTLSLGLAYDDCEVLVLAKEDKLLKNALAGFANYIPVTNETLPKFNDALYQDLKSAANNSTLNNEFGDLSFENNELVIRRTKTIAKK